MEIRATKPFDDKIVLFGQSCVGKTAFATLLTDRTYYCFDQLFHWHLLETLGMSILSNLQYIRSQCSASRWVLDGWHLADAAGKILPEGASVYVLYADYERIITQYRVPVTDPNEHRFMFSKWYHDVDYGSLPRVRYFFNDGDFVEQTSQHFMTFLEHSR